MYGQKTAGVYLYSYAHGWMAAEAYRRVCGSVLQAERTGKRNADKGKREEERGVCVKTPRVDRLRHGKPTVGIKVLTLLLLHPVRLRPVPFGHSCRCPLKQLQQSPERPARSLQGPGHFSLEQGFCWWVASNEYRDLNFTEEDTSLSLKQLKNRTLIRLGQELKKRKEELDADLSCVRSMLSANLSEEPYE